MSKYLTNRRIANGNEEQVLDGRMFGEGVTTDGVFGTGRWSYWNSQFEEHNFRHIERYHRFSVMAI